MGDVMATPAKESPYCSDSSLQVGEPLIGTATQTEAYLLLEYPGAWGEKALDESSLPSQVKTRLNELGKQIRGLKTLLIKTQSHPSLEGGIHFFIVNPTLHPPRLYRFLMSVYDDLLDLDIPAVLSGDPTYDSFLHQVPIYLVCANGRRDRCCARYGVPVFNALAQASVSSLELRVWQSTHVGGHRFAANLISLPHGLLYGRVREADALAILEAERNGRIWLPNLRGRVSIPPVAQASELFLRQQQAELDRDAYQFQDASEAGSGEWIVRFLVTATGETAIVKARLVATGLQTIESCLKEKTTQIMNYDVQYMPGK